MCANQKKDDATEQIRIDLLIQLMEEILVIQSTVLIPHEIHMEAETQGKL